MGGGSQTCSVALRKSLHLSVPCVLICHGLVELWWHSLSQYVRHAQNGSWPVGSAQSKVAVSSIRSDGGETGHWLAPDTFPPFLSSQCCVLSPCPPAIPFLSPH